MPFGAQVPKPGCVSVIWSATDGAAVIAIDWLVDPLPPWFVVNEAPMVWVPAADAGGVHWYVAVPFTIGIEAEMGCPFSVNPTEPCSVDG